MKKGIFKGVNRIKENGKYIIIINKIVEENRERVNV